MPRFTRSLPPSFAYDKSHLPRQREDIVGFPYAKTLQILSNRTA